MPSASATPILRPSGRLPLMVWFLRNSSISSFVSPSDIPASGPDSGGLHNIRNSIRRSIARMPDIPDECYNHTASVYVRRLNSSFPRWKNQHLRMTNHTLTLHKNKGSKPLEFIVLLKVQCAGRVAARPYCLQMHTNDGKIFQFAFSSDDELYTWLTKISAAISPVSKPTNVRHNTHVTLDPRDPKHLVGLPEDWTKQYSLIGPILPEITFSCPYIDLDASLSFSGPMPRDIESDSIDEEDILPEADIFSPSNTLASSNAKSEKQQLKIIIQDFSSSKDTSFSSATEVSPSTPLLTPDTSPLSPNGSPLTPFRESPYSYRASDAQDLTGQIHKLSQWADVHGGYADVWRAKWENESGVSCMVAVKVIRYINKDRDVCNNMQKRLRNEVRVWHQLRHKNVLQMYGTCDGFGPVFTSMVSPWLENGNVNTYLRNLGDKATVEVRLKLLAEAAAGLNYLHTFSFPVIHGDLKGANILVNNREEAVLADFGLSSILKSFGDSGTTTFAGGSIRWIAPELLQEPSDRCQKKTCASDTYSYGSVILEVLSGERPYKDVSNDMQVLNLVIQGCKPKRPSKHCINPEIWELIERCWDANPRERPGTSLVLLRMEQFLNAQRRRSTSS